MTQHSPETTALLVEPDDGAKLVIDLGDGEWRTIWRDDHAARGRGGLEDERWFDDYRNDPMSLHEHVKYAVTVYALGPVLVNFGRGAW
jgi:hypothetical protein